MIPCTESQPLQDPLCRDFFDAVAKHWKPKQTQKAQSSQSLDAGSCDNVVKIESDDEGEDLSELFLIKEEDGSPASVAAMATAVKGEEKAQEGAGKVKINDSARGTEGSGATESLGGPKRLKNQKFVEQAAGMTPEEIQSRIAFLQSLWLIVFVVVVVVVVGVVVVGVGVCVGLVFVLVVVVLVLVLVLASVVVVAVVVAVAVAVAVVVLVVVLAVVLVVVVVVLVVVVFVVVVLLLLLLLADFFSTGISLFQ